MSRRLYRTLSAISLLLCVVSVTAWIRSYWACEVLLVTTHATPYLHEYSSARGGKEVSYGVVESYLKIGRGVAEVRTEQSHLSHIDVPTIAVTRELMEPSDLRDDLYPGAQSVGLGFGYSYNYAILQSIYIAPIWSFALLTALLPAIRLICNIRQRRRARSGRCAQCAYDLTGNTSGVCPECGTPIGKNEALPA